MVLAQGRGRKPNGTTSWANEPWLTGAQQEDEDTFWGAPSPSPRRRAEPEAGLDAQGPAWELG